jgi:hypothetical protein
LVHGDECEVRRARILCAFDYMHAFGATGSAVTCSCRLWGLGCVHGALACSSVQSRESRVFTHHRSAQETAAAFHALSSIPTPLHSLYPKHPRTSSSTHSTHPSSHASAHSCQCQTCPGVSCSLPLHIHTHTRTVHPSTPASHPSPKPPAPLAHPQLCGLNKLHPYNQEASDAHRAECAAAAGRRSKLERGRQVECGICLERWGWEGRGLQNRPGPAPAFSFYQKAASVCRVYRAATVCLQGIVGSCMHPLPVKLQPQLQPRFLSAICGASSKQEFLRSEAQPGLAAVAHANPPPPPAPRT